VLRRKSHCDRLGGRSATHHPNWHLPEDTLSFHRIIMNRTPHERTKTRHHRAVSLHDRAMKAINQARPMVTLRA